MPTLRDYFWPDGWWAGYAKFFEPHIPGRIGTVLIGHIHRAAKGDKQARDSAVELLSRSHTKVVSHVRGVPPIEVVCHPTPEAQVAIAVLKSES